MPPGPARLVMPLLKSSPTSDRSEVETSALDPYGRSFPSPAIGKFRRRDLRAEQSELPERRWTRSRPSMLGMIALRPLGRSSRKLATVRFRATTCTHRAAASVDCGPSSSPMPRTCRPRVPARADGCTCPDLTRGRGTHFVLSRLVPAHRVPGQAPVAEQSAQSSGSEQP